MTAQRVALVTGSGKKRVGWFVADALAQRGYAIAVHFHTSKDEAHAAAATFRRHGVEADPFQADLRKESEVQEMVAQVMARFGRIDSLVHCAAIWHSQALEDVTAQQVREFFDSNTLSTFLISQQVGLLMTQQTEGGSIVLVGDWAIARPYLDYAAYFVSKGSVPTLTRCLAIELASRNPRVRVNCIEPGPVMLPPSLPAEEREKAISGTLVKREGRPENVALAAVHFIENDFITGACLPVDGGRTLCE